MDIYLTNGQICRDKRDLCANYKHTGEEQAWAACSSRPLSELGLEASTPSLHRSRKWKAGHSVAEERLGQVDPDFPMVNYLYHALTL